VVDKETGADSGTGVDIDTGEGVGVFTPYTWQERNFGGVEGVSQAVDADGIDPGVTEDHLHGGGGGGVAFISGLNITAQSEADLRERFEQSGDDSGGLIVAVVAIVTLIEGALISEGTLDLVAQLVCGRGEGTLEYLCIRLMRQW
jgi:hypothetical protein